MLFKPPSAWYFVMAVQAKTDFGTKSEAAVTIPKCVEATLELDSV